MSETDLKDTKMLLYLKDDKWSSIESIAVQKRMRLTKSESLFKIPFRLDSNATFSELELREIKPDESNASRNWELIRDTSRFPLMQQSRNLMTGELEMLKINLSMNDGVLASRKSMSDVQREDRRRKMKKLAACWTKSESFLSSVPIKVKNLLTEIEAATRVSIYRTLVLRRLTKTHLSHNNTSPGSESAKTDTVIWKFLKRGTPFRKEIFKAKKFTIEIKTLKLSDPYIQNTQPSRITCPNCNFFVTTNVKKVSTMHTKLFAMFLSVIGLCIIPRIFYTYKDTVHTCPLCKIYLGFCPAFGIWSKRKMIRALKHQELKSIVNVESKKMVSASSTSAKNLFVESKLRLSDRVQVNVNNIAAVARQIQRGSKANENLIGAAKNFALQEPAIDNSETNLKKLKLLTTHINNQLDSIHNSSMKMESVLEQVRSMQR